MSIHATVILIALGVLISCQNAGRRNDTEDDCSVDDGTQPAKIDYFNPKTGYSATYLLHVEVENCRVIQIDFNNGGYLDSDHIDPADIDEDGDASIVDDKGRRFEVHIQK
jgi:hypothetical protein